MKDPAIRIRGLSKAYRKGGRSSGSLRETLTSGWTGISRETFFALKDIDLDIDQGESVGIIGRNGAGKSTLLKIISRITEPTSGRIEITGKVSSLLEVGTGFHPELTGRENIYLNGTILGMRRAEIRDKFDEIVEFSGVSGFLDTAVKHYSSGMKVRLAFSVAAYLEPEVLVVDEVLAVGDAEFQRKCLDKMGEVTSGGRTVLFVSHNLSAVQSLCNRAILIQNGTIGSDSDSASTIQTYLSTSIQKDEFRSEREGRGDKRLVFTGVDFLNKEGEVSDVLFSGMDTIIRLNYACKRELVNVHFAIQIISAKGQVLATMSNVHSRSEFSRIAAGNGSADCIIPKLPLNNGNYLLRIWAISDGDILDEVDLAVKFSVEPGYFFRTGKLPIDKQGLLVDHDWKIT